MSALTCPRCNAPQSDWVGRIVPGVYDGVLIWSCFQCLHEWPRFSPDPASGYSKLHDIAVERIANGGRA